MEHQKLLTHSLTLARKYKSEGKLARAYAHYLVSWELSKRSDFSHLDVNEVLETLKNLTSHLEANGRFQDAFSSFEQALEVLPKNDETLHSYGSLLAKNGKFVTAIKVLKKIQSGDLKFNELSNNVKSLAIDGWHFTMLNDKTRNLAYYQAIQEEGTENDVVLDVGTGSGILALFAAKAKAKKVIACDASEVCCDIAAKVIEANGLKDRIELHNKLSTHLKLDQPIDVLITETFDAGLLGEHVLEILDHAWKHLLHSKSRILPGKAKVWIALATSEKMLQKTRLLKKKAGNLDVSSLNLMAKETSEEPYDCSRLKPDQVLSDPVELIELDFNDKDKVEKYLRESNMFERTLEVTKIGKVDCVALWFELQLGRQKVSSSPGIQSCWEQALFALPNQLENDSNPGDQIKVNLKLKGHFELTKVTNQKSISNGTSESKQTLVPQSFVKILNSNTDWNYCPSGLGQEASILDLTSLPLMSLNLLKSRPDAKMTMFMWPRDEDAKAKLDLVSEVAELNNISLSRIDGLSQVDNGGYDLAVLDPVSKSGRLDETALHLLEEIRPLVKTVSPEKVHLYVALIESEELAKRHRLFGDEAVLDFKIANFMNEYSIDHLQQVNLSEIRHRFLSKPAKVLTLDLSKTLEAVTDEVEIELTESGEAHGIAYWFETSTGLNTLENEAFDQAVIMFDDKVPVDVKDECVCCEITLQDCYLDLKLSKE